MRIFERCCLFPNIKPNTRAVNAPDSPNEFAKKNKTNNIPNVNMYACRAFPNFVETYIQGIPTPKPRNVVAANKI